MVIKTKNKMMKKYLVIGILVVLILPLVSAIGVGSIYSGSKSPLKLLLGEEKIVFLELQNWDTEEDLTLEGEILKGMDMAYLEDSETKVPYQQKVNTKMVVKAPENAEIGDTYNIEYIFRQVPPRQEEGGTLTFSQSLIRNFDVVIVEEAVPEPPAPSVPRTGFRIGYGWVILLIILIAIVIILIKKKKK
jgi:hypothetical protein